MAITKEELKKIQRLALAFMQSASKTRDIDSNSLTDFLGRLDCKFDVENFGTTTSEEDNN